jgi:hypothetical protein
MASPAAAASRIKVLMEILQETGDRLSRKTPVSSEGLGD